MKEKERIKPFNIETDNPVNYYNEHFTEHTISSFLDLKPMRRVGVDATAYVLNNGDETERMFVFSKGFMTVKKLNGLALNVGEKYSCFDVLRIFTFDKDFMRTLNYVLYELLNVKTDYIRVGIKYFRIITKTDRYGISRTENKPWDKSTLLDDYDKDFLPKIPKYKDFTIEPDNKGFRESKDGNYNLYSPFAHKPDKEFKGMEAIKWSEILMQHIFGEQYDIGLKYLKVLYDLPRQALPILVLTSEERQTGKTTFVDWINIIFGANAVVINPQDIGSSFNASYSDKNVIIIEESRFENVQATEKLKNLSTQKKILTNTKHVAEYSIPFYGKIIITSNDENKFSKVDNPEIRYWVRKIPSLTGKSNHSILDDLVNEIPQFIAYLNTLPDIDTTKSRMVFEAEELTTEALQTVKDESKPELQKEIEMLLDTFCMENYKHKEFKFCASDIKRMWFKSNNQISLSYINKILKQHMKLSWKSDVTERYVAFEAHEVYPTKRIGKPYKIQNEYYNMKLEKEEEVEPNVPF